MARQARKNTNLVEKVKKLSSGITPISFTRYVQGIIIGKQNKLRLFKNKIKK